MIAIIFAFFVVLHATGNIVITIYAIITVTFVISSVVALMVGLGWEMGVCESISVVILIGFSVDYIIHLATHYSHSTLKSRGARSRETLREMGVSIFSGGITTLGSGSFLFGG